MILEGGGQVLWPVNLGLGLRNVCGNEVPQAYGAHQDNDSGDGWSSKMWRILM